MIPLKTYNYSYIQSTLADKYGQKVSLPMVISVARKHGFYLPKRKRKTHEREVLTHSICPLCPEKMVSHYHP
ncbi:MAG: hypothetical protein N3D15_05105 [Syntrophorhabdaceae bacterium]|nr:hypothetical protein [Syntrophorhabdaceae bacterium]